MSLSIRVGLGIFVALSFMATCTADDKPADYLTKDGKLIDKLEVKDVQGGFAGFTGHQWVIETSGEWTASRVFNKKLDMEKKGKLTPEQLAALAKELARYELLKLESKEPAKPMANPHLVTIKFGKREATLTLGAGEALPKPDPDKPTATVPGRYAGIVNAVKELLKEDKPKGK